jgi:hypothetical protein
LDCDLIDLASGADVAGSLQPAWATGNIVAELIAE